MCLTLTIFVRRPRTVDVGYHMGVVTMPLAVFLSTSTYLMDCLHIHPASAPASAAAFGFLTVPGSLSLPACPKAQSRFISILTSECSVWVMATCSAHALQLFSCDVLSAGSQCHEHYMALHRGSPFSHLVILFRKPGNHSRDSGAPWPPRSTRRHHEWVLIPQHS